MVLSTRSIKFVLIDRGKYRQWDLLFSIHHVCISWLFHHKIKYTNTDHFCSIKMFRYVN